MPTLILKEQGTERMIPLTKGTTSVGRSRTNDIRIHTDMASRCHLNVIKTEQGYTVVDLNSSNGTHVNGEKIEEKLLKEGDVIQVGKTQLIFTEKTHEEDLPSPAGIESATVPMSDPKVGKLIETIIAATKVQELAPFLNIVVDNIIAITGAERGIILLHDPASGSLTIHTARDNEGALIKDIAGFSRSVPQKAIAGRKAVVQMDIGTEDASSPTPSMKFYQLRTVMCAPLYVGESLLGALYVDSRASAKEFSANDLAIFEAVSNNVALAIENVRTRDEIARKNEGIRRALEEENAWLKSSFAKRSQIIGESKAIQTVYETIRRVATTDATVMILGESGTGKEAIALAIHDLGARSKKPFVVVDCAAIPETLLESELFGYEKGAFTGAASSKKGKFEQANGGTLFLDEIAELPLTLQVKLLRAIESREVNVLGGTTPVAIDVRVVTATNQDVEKLVAQSKFRQDLYHRLKVVTIAVPPLKDRREDIVLLARHFLHAANTVNDRKVRGFTDDAQEAMKEYAWPGNVRELKHKIEQAVILTNNEFISPKDIGLAKSKEKILPLEKVRDDFEKQYILKALAHFNYNVTHTAEALGITRQHLQNLIKEYNIVKPD